MLKMYNNLYHFYLEKRDDVIGVGPFLKYGRKGKNSSYSLDLGVREIPGGVTLGTLVIKNPESRTKFKIVTNQLTLRLRAETRSDREAWYTALLQEISKS